MKTLSFKTFNWKLTTSYNHETCRFSLWQQWQRDPKELIMESYDLDVICARFASRAKGLLKFYENL